MSKKKSGSQVLAQKPLMFTLGIIPFFFVSFCFVFFQTFFFMGVSFYGLGARYTLARTLPSPQALE